MLRTWLVHLPSVVKQIKDTYCVASGRKIIYLHSNTCLYIIVL